MELAGFYRLSWPQWIFWAKRASRKYNFLKKWPFPTFLILYYEVFLVQYKYIKNKEKFYNKLFEKISTFFFPLKNTFFRKAFGLYIFFSYINEDYSNNETYKLYYRFVISLTNFHHSFTWMRPQFGFSHLYIKGIVYRKLRWVKSCIRKLILL